MTSIDFDSGGESEIKAEVLRLRNTGDGVHGIVFDAAKRQATDWQTREPKTWPDGNPVWEFVYNIAAIGAKGSFTVRDEDGDPIKDRLGQNQLEQRTVTNGDVSIVTSSYALFKTCRAEKLNTGHEVRIERLSPEGAKQIEWKVDVLGKHDNPTRFDEPKQSIADTDYDDGSEPFS